MGREKAGFRDVMAQLNESFPDQGMLTPADVAAFIGCSYTTVKRMRARGELQFNAMTGRITKADLARQVCT